MKEENTVLLENEVQANIIVARVMRITFAIFTLVFILNVIGVFIVDMGVMTAAYILGSVCLWCPTLLVNVLKKQESWVKYVNVVCAVMMLTITVITLTYHVVVFYVFGIAIASLYFSKRLNIFATILTVAGVSGGQLLAVTMDTVVDKNFQELSSVVIFGIIPRALLIIAVAAVFTMLSSRTAGMLSNLMGAEEQERVLKQMKIMKENSIQTVDKLLSMVEELSVITAVSMDANNQIAKETENMRSGFAENTQQIENMHLKVQDMASQLLDLSDRNAKVADLAGQVSENTNVNQQRMDFATDSMESIHESTNICKDIIHNLGEESKEIFGIIQVITGISSRTKILALNATIEAARAGEHGKGFVVVAEEIQKLSEQTNAAVDSIGKIVNQVVHDTEEAVSAMEQSAELTQKGRESIQEAGESAALITSSNEEMSGQIIFMDKISDRVSESSSEVAKGMDLVSQNTQQHYHAVEQVTAATQENRTGTERLAEIVEMIKGVSEQLNQVIQE